MDKPYILQIAICEDEDAERLSSLIDASGVIETGSTMTMEDFGRQLPTPRFMRCHKSYIVNMSRVENGHTVYIRRGDVAKCARELDKWRLYEAGRDDI